MTTRSETPDTPLSFGDCLKAYRKARDMTQAELAELVGYSLVSIRKIESDQQRPSKYLAERLADKLALSPDEAAAFIRLARALPAGPAPAVLVPASDNMPTRLPPLVGRTPEIVAACALLQEAEVSLLTLTGPGGVGKTRLAIQVATELQSYFEHGVCFVALASVSDPALVVPTLAQTLGLGARGGQKLDELLKDYLSNRELLLLLDNFEQVTAAVPLLGELLTVAPRLKILVTSRVTLGLYREQEFNVPPLSVPDLGHLPAVEVLRHSPAIALFVARAKAVNPEFTLTPDNAPLVAEICTRLDGLPLAIELAAARIKVLSPSALLKELSHRLTLLTGGRQDQPQRHRALRNTIAWSYQLLEADEKRLFARLAVFVGGCTLPAVENICVLESEPVSQRSLLDQLQALLDKSMLQQTPAPDGELRFTLLETLHEYALEQLLTYPEIESLRQRHAEYYSRLAEAIVPELWGAEAGRWLQQLLAEYGNLQAAMRWLIERGHGERAIRLFEVLVHFWEMQRKPSEIRGQTEVILEMSRALPAAMRAMALGVAGAMFRDMQFDYARARACYTEQLSLARGQGDIFSISVALDELGLVLLEQGEYAEAERLLQESYALRQTMGDQDLIASLLRSLGIIALYQGELEQAQARLEKSLVLHQALKNRLGYARTLNQLGRVALYQHDYVRAQALHEESQALFRQIGNQRSEANALSHLGPVWLAQGERERAISALRESARLWQNLEDRHGNIWNLERFAEIAVAQGQAARAAQLWGAAEALREQMGVPLPPVERDRYAQPLAAAREQLPETAWRSAWAAGRAMSLEQALAYALQDGE